jgi:hypothetical protein
MTCLVVVLNTLKRRGDVCWVSPVPTTTSKLLLNSISQMRTAPIDDSENTHTPPKSKLKIFTPTVVPTARHDRSWLKLTHSTWNAPSAPAPPAPSLRAMAVSRGVRIRVEEIEKRQKMS